MNRPFSPDREIAGPNHRQPEEVRLHVAARGSRLMAAYVETG
jgi:hypothetical protein